MTEIHSISGMPFVYVTGDLDKESASEFELTHVENEVFVGLSAIRSYFHYVAMGLVEMGDENSIEILSTLALPFMDVSKFVEQRKSVDSLSPEDFND